jgi:hypothetical protein
MIVTSTKYTKKRRNKKMRLNRVAMPEEVEKAVRRLLDEVPDKMCYTSLDTEISTKDTDEAGNINVLYKAYAGPPYSLFGEGRTPNEAISDLIHNIEKDEA